jgi:hypothetical protein
LALFQPFRSVTHAATILLSCWRLLAPQVDDSETEEDPDAPWGEGAPQETGRSRKAGSGSAMDVDSQEAAGDHADDVDDEDTDEDERDEEDEAVEAAAQAGSEGIGRWWAWAYNARTGLRRCLGTDTLGRRYWLMAGRAGAYQVCCFVLLLLI